MAYICVVTSLLVGVCTFNILQLMYKQCFSVKIQLVSVIAIKTYQANMYVI